jgi:hypothetical protein
MNETDTVNILTDISMRQGIIENYTDVVDGINNIKIDLLQVFDIMKKMNANMEKICNKVDNFDNRLKILSTRISKIEKYEKPCKSCKSCKSHKSKSKSNIIHIKNND